MKRIVWRAILSLVIAPALLGQSSPYVDLPMVHKVQTYLGLEQVPEQRIQEILQVQFEFSAGGTMRQHTTFGHWIIGTINTLQYGQALRSGLRTGEFFTHYQQYFNQVLDTKLDPVRSNADKVRDAARDIFTTWGDQLAGSSAQLGTLNTAVDTFLMTVDVLEVRSAFSQFFNQERDKWMLTYFQARDSGESDDQAWESIEPAITLRVDKRRLRVYFDASYQAYTLAADPSTLKATLRSMIEALFPWNKNAVRLVNSSWSGYWQTDARNCPGNQRTTAQGSFPPQQIVINLQKDIAFVTGNLSGPGIRRVDLGGPDASPDLKVAIDVHGQSPAGNVTMQVKGVMMTGYIEELPVRGYCNWRGPFQARLAVIRGTPGDTVLPTPGRVQ